jgi:hypothetical protein
MSIFVKKYQAFKIPSKNKYVFLLLYTCDLIDHSNLDLISIKYYTVQMKSTEFYITRKI